MGCGIGYTADAAPHQQHYFHGWMPGTGKRKPHDGMPVAGALLQLISQDLGPDIPDRPDMARGAYCS